MHLGRAAAVAIIVGAVSGAAARADDTADEAEFRFRHGAALYAHRDFAGALSEFYVSNRLVHNPNVVFNIGRCLEELGQLNEAYRTYAGLLDEPLTPGDRADLQASLKRMAARVALVRIETNPPGAAVYVGRRNLGALGQTPRTLALPPGKAHLILDLAGYRPSEADAVLSVGAEQQVHVALERILGRLDLRISPAAALVRLDGSGGVAVHAGDPLVPGHHTLFISADGYLPQTVGIEAAADQTTAVELALAPRPSPSGAVVARANLDGALIKIDGKEMGFTPAVIEPVGEGRHEVVITADQRDPWVQQVEVKANERAFVDAVLRRAQPTVEAASRTAERASEAPASVTVISREEIQAFGYQTLAEALSSVRGLYVSNDRTYTSIGFRGFSPLGDYNNRVLILVDGHAVYDPWVGQGYVGRELDVDLADVERIEVVRGAGSALYGTGAFFGVINVVHRPLASGTHAELEGSLGALGADLARASGSAANRGAGVGVTAAYYSAAGEPVYISPQPIDGQTVSAASDAERAFHGGLRAHAGDFSISADFNTRTKDSPTAQFQTTFGLDEVSEDTIGYAEARYAHAFESGLILSARAWYDGSRFTGDYLYGLTPGAPTTQDQVQTGGADSLGSEVRVQLPTLLENHPTVGAAYEDRFHIFQTSEANGIFALDDSHEGEQIASTYLNDEWTPTRRIAFTAGVRLDDYRIIHDDAYFATLVAVNPRLAAIAHLYEGATTKLLLGRAFRAPSIYERFFGDGVSQEPAGNLSPELIYSAELEHTHPITDEAWVTGSIFYSNIAELIQLGTDPANGLSEYQNIPGHVQSYGAELEVRYQPDQALLLEGAYSYQHTMDDSGSPIYNSPAHIGVLRAMAPLVAELLTASTELVYNSARLAPGVSSPVEVGESVIWNAVLSGEYARYHLRYSAGIFNLLDTGYSLPAQGELPGVTVVQYGRTLRLSVGLTF